jgi:hypothetical protein
MSLKKNKKGVSTLVATVLMLALTFAMFVLVFVLVRNIVDKNIESSEACYNTFEKVTLDSRYTCYNSSGGANEVQFAVIVGDLDDLEDIIVGIASQGDGTTFRVAEDPIELTYYNRTQGVRVPGKNSGYTYIYNVSSFFSSHADSIEIAPVVNGETCSTSYSINQLDSCGLLA